MSDDDSTGAPDVAREFKNVAEKLKARAEATDRLLESAKQSAKALDEVASSKEKAEGDLAQCRRELASAAQQAEAKVKEAREAAEKDRSEAAAEVVEQKKIAAEARDSVKALEQELATERTKSKEAEALKEEITRHKDLLDASMKAEREAKSQVEAAQSQVNSIRDMLNQVKNSVPAGDVEKDLEELSSLAAEGPSTGELDAAADRLDEETADQKAQLANPRAPDQSETDQGVAEQATGVAKKAMSAVTGFLTGKGGSDDDAQKGGWRAHHSSRKRGSRALSRLSSIEREFRALDKNGDGKITLSEYIRTKKKTKKRKGAKGGGRTKRRRTRKNRRTRRRLRRSKVGRRRRNTRRR